jgi:HPt (histidine-containing phosphotransfer) domain-containing protein
MAWDAGMVDLDEAITRSMGRKELYKGWLDNFFEDVTFAPAEAAFANKDVKAAEAALHKIKGTAGNLSVKKVYAIAVAMGDKIKAGNDTEVLEGDFKALREEFTAARAMYNDNIDVLLNYGELIF